MNKTNKQKWIRALRSGKYKQTQGTLQGEIIAEDEDGYENPTDEIGFCCLGVLLDVQKTLGGRWEYDEYIFPVKPDDVDSEYCDSFEDRLENELSSIALDKLGIPNPIHATLIRMNDVEKKSFTEIADYIEENL